MNAFVTNIEFAVNFTGAGRCVNTNRLTVSGTTPQRAVIAASYCLDTNYATENAPKLFMLKMIRYRLNGMAY
jgi:hypothetical protein